MPATESSARIPSLVDPPIEGLLAKTENSKFTLVVVAATRAREINEYYSGLGSGHGTIIPPQVRLASNKSLTIALEEIAQDRLVARRLTEEERVARDAAPAPAPTSELDAFTEMLTAE